MKAKRIVIYVKNQRGKYYKFKSRRGEPQQSITFVTKRYTASKFLDANDAYYLIEYIKNLYLDMTFTMEKVTEEYECKSTHIWRRIK